MKKKKKAAVVYAFVEFMLSEKPAYAAEKLQASYLASAMEFLARPEEKPAYSKCGWCDARFTIGYNEWFCSEGCAKAHYQEYLESDI